MEMTISDAELKLVAYNGRLLNDAEYMGIARDLLSTRAQLAALQDKVAFQPMSTFKPTADKLQNYLVLYGDAEIAIATFQNTDNPEESGWYCGYEINEIYPYGWMNLPEPKVIELPIPAEGE
ncbi:hypothetical protein CCP3SC15_1920003 [Gammaproteobacteria bacterium]